MKYLAFAPGGDCVLGLCRLAHRQPPWLMRAAVRVFCASDLACTEYPHSCTLRHQLAVGTSKSGMGVPDTQQHNWT